MLIHRGKVQILTPAIEILNHLRRFLFIMIIIRERAITILQAKIDVPH